MQNKTLLPSYPVRKLKSLSRSLLSKVKKQINTIEGRIADLIRTESNPLRQSQKAHFHYKNR